MEGPINPTAQKPGHWPTSTLRRPLRIVHVYKDAFPVVGGIENHVRLLCRELAQDPDLDVRILVTSQDRHSSVDRLDGVPLTRVGRVATLASTPISLRMPLELRRLRPDIVHLHAPYPIGELSALVSVPLIPTVITYHSDIVRQKKLLKIYGPVLQRVLARAQRILVTSPAYLDSSPWLQSVRSQCTIIPLGIDLAPFVAVNNAGTGNTLLFVGRFRYYKGLHVLLQAMLLMPDVKLILVGDGPALPELRAQADQLGITARVEFVIGVDDPELPGFYARADVFVLPACQRSEAFGLVLVEAEASGLPCISTELNTGTSYVNKNELTGLVVPPDDPQAIAAACLSLLADPRRRAAMGASARDRAKELFDIRRVSRQVASVYREVAEGSRSAPH